MSYVTEINGFHKWIQTHPELPISARLLWFTLMHYNNSCGWKRVFNVPMSFPVYHDRQLYGRVKFFKS